MKLRKASGLQEAITLISKNKNKPGKSKLIHSCITIIKNNGIDIRGAVLGKYSVYYNDDQLIISDGISVF